MTREIRLHNPPTLMKAAGFSHGAEARGGRMLFFAGQVAKDKDGQTVGPGDLVAQFRQVCENLKTVVTAAGGGLSDVVKLTIYVLNYSPRDFAAIREAGAEFLPARNPPAGIVVGVQSLPMEGLLIAVDATAVIRAMFQPRVR